MKCTYLKLKHGSCEMSIYQLSYISGKRIPAPNKGRCGDVKPSKCSDCSMYYFDSNSQKSDDDRKCVWIPDRKACKNKISAITEGWIYVEFCPGKNQTIALAL